MPRPAGSPSDERSRESGEMAPQPRSRSRLKWIAIPVLLLAVIGAGLYWLHASHFESTDDAQIDGHINPVSARVGGRVIELLVKDNQYVEAGTVLVRIDPKDYQVLVDRAKADVAEAEAVAHASGVEVPVLTTTTSSQLSGAQAGVGEAQANVASAQTSIDAARAKLDSAQAMVRQAQANYTRASRDLDRMKALVAKEEISRQQYDATVAAADALRAQVDSAQAQVNEATQGVRVAESKLHQEQAKLAKAKSDAQSAGTGPQQVMISRARAASASARVLQARAALEQAELNLDYTTVKAPVAGVVSQRTVEVGQNVALGQPLLAVVPLSGVWVTANFKESQLEHMRPGQPATITVDAYGGKEFRGHVDSIAGATGARFSLLPPENATGNYVKVVQRVPVKIVLEQGEDPGHVLRPGMSVTPKVRVK